MINHLHSRSLSNTQPGAARLWFCGCLGGEQSPHTTQKAPALKIVSFLPSMCCHWRGLVTCSRRHHSTKVEWDSLPLWLSLLLFFFSWLPLSLSPRVVRQLLLALWGWRSETPMSQEASEGVECSTASASSAYGEQRSLFFPSFTLSSPSLSLSPSSYNCRVHCSSLPLSSESWAG